MYENFQMSVNYSYKYSLKSLAITLTWKGLPKT